jgi:hypothetical protein
MRDLSQQFAGGGDHRFDCGHLASCPEIAGMRAGAGNAVHARVGGKK